MDTVIRCECSDCDSNCNGDCTEDVVDIKNFKDGKLWCATRKPLDGKKRKQLLGLNNKRKGN